MSWLFRAKKVNGRSRPSAPANWEILSCAGEGLGREGTWQSSNDRTHWTETWGNTCASWHPCLPQHVMEVLTVALMTRFLDVGGVNKKECVNLFSPDGQTHTLSPAKAPFCAWKMSSPFSALLLTLESSRNTLRASTLRKQNQLLEKSLEILS